MNCLTNLEVTFASASAASLWVVSALMLIWVLRNNRFAGQPTFVLTLMAMLWWLFTVTLDLASQGEACKVGWSLAAWPGITLLPIAWAFFVFDHTLNMNKGPHPIRLLLYVGLPCLVSAIALTNSQTHLFYGTDTRLVTQGSNTYVIFDHGPLFFACRRWTLYFCDQCLGRAGPCVLQGKEIIRPI